jgi:diguanylate cyclase (GGDEF)-like protein
MSLIKQLWIGIIFILLVAMIGNFAITLASSKHYLEEQLQLKNIDNANSLALSMSQMNKDVVTLELLISAQFDTGHYQYIKLVDPNNQLLIEKTYESNADDNQVPRWFQQAIVFNTSPGIAQIQDQWQQFGTLKVKSHDRFALIYLWQSAKEFIFWYLLTLVVCGLLGTWILKYITHPLDSVVEQAEAIGDKRFVMSEEPRTTEFQRVVKAMNRLSSSVRLMLEKETKQLEVMRSNSQQDPLTGLANRSHFLNIIESKFNREESTHHGLVAMIRLLNLTSLNHLYGHQTVDTLIRDLAEQLKMIASEHEASYAGRLNGSDFALLIDNDYSIDLLSAQLTRQCNAYADSMHLSQFSYAIAICTYKKMESRAQLLHELDGALATAEMKGNRAVVILQESTPKLFYKNLNEWRSCIHDAVEQEHFHLASFPVKNAQQILLHNELPVRMDIDGITYSAGYFIPWAIRLSLMPSIDASVLKLALKRLSKDSSPIAINLSADSLCSADFRETTLHLLQQTPAPLLQQLWVEFPEVCAVRHMAEFRIFCLTMKSFGVKIGLEHVGLAFTEFKELQDLGVHHIKIDSSLIHDINTNTNNQAFIERLCKIGQSIGIIMIAEGVQREEEYNCLISLSADGFTGPFIK